MTDYKCSACGAIFPNEEALLSHAKMKVAEESIHYRKMSAHGQTVPIYPSEQEKPA
jgi:DNA-directed RNA polymerase subunit RPC12/RpoP